MGTENVIKRSNNQPVDNIMRWLLFGIFLVVAPPLFNVWYKIIIGFDIDFIEYIPDMLLAMLSVCCNLLNTFVDSDKRISRLLRWIFGILLGSISLGCWGFFFIIRFSIPQNWLTNSFAETLFYFCTGVILSCALTGIIIEWHTVYKNNKNDN